MTISKQFLNWSLDCLDANRINEAREQANSMSMLDKSIAATEKQLTNLTRMRYSDLIDDDQFLREQTDLKKMLHGLKAQQEKTSGTNTETIIQTRDVFHFSHSALIAFKNGSKRVRREIIGSLGSNYSIIDGKPIIEAFEWLKLIKETYKVLRDKIEGLELDKALSQQARKTRIDLIRSRWCATVQDVRNCIEKEASVQVPKFTN
jgi:hypothetical protein